MVYPLLAKYTVIEILRVVVANWHLKSLFTLFLFRRFCFFSRFQSLFRFVVFKGEPTFDLFESMFMEDIGSVLSELSFRVFFVFRHVEFFVVNRFLGSRAFIVL
nr:hypothetical protein [Crucivirus sp.]